MTSLQVKQIGASLLFSTPQRQTPRATLASLIAIKIQQRTKRVAFNKMLELSPHILKDIGVTYGDVKWAANLPIKMDAACELRKSMRIGPMHI